MITPEHAPRTLPPEEVSRLLGLYHARQAAVAPCVVLRVYPDRPPEIEAPEGMAPEDAHTHLTAALSYLLENPPT